MLLAEITDAQYTLVGIIVVAIVAPTWMSLWNGRIAKRQVTSNGGTSMKDQITRIETKTDILGLVQVRHCEEMKGLAHGLGQVKDTIDILQQTQEQRRETITQEQDVL